MKCNTLQDNKKQKLKNKMNTLNENEKINTNFNMKQCSENDLISIMIQNVEKNSSRMSFIEVLHSCLPIMLSQVIILNQQTLIRLNDSLVNFLYLNQMHCFERSLLNQCVFDVFNDWISIITSNQTNQQKKKLIIHLIVKYAQNNNMSFFSLKNLTSCQNINMNILINQNNFNQTSIDMSLLIKHDPCFHIKSSNHKNNSIDFVIRNSSICNYKIMAFVYQETKMSSMKVKRVKNIENEISRFSQIKNTLTCQEMYDSVEEHDFLDFSKNFKIIFCVHCYEGNDFQDQPIAPILKQYIENTDFKGTSYHSFDCVIFSIPFTIEKYI